MKTTSIKVQKMNSLRGRESGAPSTQRPHRPRPHAKYVSLLKTLAAVSQSVPHLQDDESALKITTKCETVEAPCKLLLTVKCYMGSGDLLVAEHSSLKVVSGCV